MNIDEKLLLDLQLFPEDLIEESPMEDAYNQLELSFEDSDVTYNPAPTDSESIQEKVTDSDLLEDLILRKLQESNPAEALRLFEDNHEESEVDITFINRAISCNPLIKLYKIILTKIPDNIKVESDDVGYNVSLKAPKKFILDQISPLIKSFDFGKHPNSPISQCVKTLVGSLKAAEEDSKVENVIRDKRYTDITQNIDQMPYLNSEGVLMDTENVEYAADVTLRVDDDDSLGQTRIQEFFSTTLRPADLSNKAIAEHFIAKSSNKDLSEYKIREELRHRGFKDRRINEILGIINFRKKTLYKSSTTDPFDIEF